GTANFTIVVTNTGDVALSNVTVTDALAADCVRTGAGNLGTLAPSASTSYTCSVTNVLADFVNEAIVTGTPPVGADVTDSDISTVDVIFPSIYIRKNAHDPDSQLARVNDTVTFTIYVENTGDVDLANVAVTDPLASECDSTIGDLVVDATSTYTCTLVVTADVENIATVTGTPPVGANVTDSDPSSVDVIHPSIDIRKNMEGTDSQQAVVGSTVTFTINVRNTGDVALTNVAVSDPLAPNCVSTIGNLAVGTSITPYTCTLVVTDDMTNVATVTGMAPVGPDVTDTDPSSVDVITPAIYIQKNAHDLDSQLVLLGSTVTFTIYVQNTGNVTLTNVTVTDPLAPNCDRTGLNNLGTLLPGATSSYNCTAIATTGFTNVATVTGTPPVGSNVTDNDPSQVVIANPAMRVTKSVTSTGPYSLGSTISYTILVENIGDIALTGVTVTDPGTGVTLGACTPTIPATLAVAASLTCQATHVVTQADIDGGGFYNVAFADSNETEEVSDDEAVDIERTPAIDIRKNAESTDTQQILLGGNATFHIVVTNTGNLTLYNVAVTDVLAPDCERITPDLGTLLPGGSVEYDCTVTNVTLGFTNIAQVTALAPNEAVVTDEDPSTVTILVNPSNLAKQLISTNQSFTTGDKVAIGEIITYRVTAVIPSTSQYSSMKLTDSMDRGLAFVDCTSITGTGLVTSIGSLDDVCANTIGTTYLPGSLDPRDQGRQVVFDFGTLENPTQSDITLTITYTAVVLNSSGNVNGIDLGNSVNLTWGVGSSLGPVAAPDVEIVEPRLNVTKTATPTLITVGTEVTFTLTIAHDPAFSTTEAYNVILIDQLPVELGNVSGLDCTTGAQDPATCIYSSSTRTLRAEWSSFTRSAGNGVIIFRATVLSIPDSREITNSITGEWTSLPGDVSDPQSDFNDLSDERTFPPGMSVDNYIDTDEIVLRPASQPSTGFAPGRQTVIDLPRSSIYAELGDLTLEIPILGVNIPIVGVPLVDQEWDLTWLWNKAGWLNETAYPTWNGNSVMTGHVYLPNGLPGPFLNLDKLEWGDQIIVHANGLRYIYQIRAVNTVKADDMSAFKHEEKSWVTLITCKEYNETTDTYKKRIVVQAVLVEITKELGATQ
ncbi:MAG: sortase, partial [Anaerolineaceae bacterium]